MRESLKCDIRVFSLFPDGFHREIWLKRRRSTRAYPITRIRVCYCDVWFLRTPKLRNEFAFYLSRYYTALCHFFFFITTGLYSPPRLAAAHTPAGLLSLYIYRYVHHIHEYVILLLSSYYIIRILYTSNRTYGLLTSMSYVCAGACVQPNRRRFIVLLYYINYK